MLIVDHEVKVYIHEPIVDNGVYIMEGHFVRQQYKCGRSCWFRYNGNGLIFLEYQHDQRELERIYMQKVLT